MEIVVRARLEWNEELQKQLERSLEFAVNRHKDRIDRISISLTDLNGPRGGKDKLCHIAAEVRGARPVMILEQGDNLLAVLAVPRGGWATESGAVSTADELPVPRSTAPQFARRDHSSRTASWRRRGFHDRRQRPLQRRSEEMIKERVSNRLQTPSSPEVRHSR